MGLENDSNIKVRWRIEGPTNSIDYFNIKWSTSDDEGFAKIQDGTETQYIIHGIKASRTYTVCLQINSLLNLPMVEKCSDIKTSNDSGGKKYFYVYIYKLCISF